MFFFAFRTLYVDAISMVVDFVSIMFDGMLVVVGCILTAAAAAAACC